MNEGNEKADQFSKAMLYLIKDQSAEFKEAVCWFAENINDFDSLFESSENEEEISKEEYKARIKECAEKKDYRMALIYSYKMVCETDEPYPTS